MYVAALKKPAISLASVVCLGLSVPSGAQSSAHWNGLPLGQIQLKGQAVLVVSASTERERVLSLDKYATLAAGEGVLHVFPETGKRCLLTRQIPLDLDAAYLDAHNRVVAIGQLAARQPQAQCGQTPAQQLLTVPKGQLAALGLKVGDTVSGFRAMDAQVLAQTEAQVAARRAQQAAQAAALEAQDRQAPPRINLRTGGKPLQPLLVFLPASGGMDSQREASKVALDQGWLYVFETELKAGDCRPPVQLHGPLWERLKYHQYAFDRHGKLLGSTMRDDGKLCTGEKGVMRYALVLPHTAQALTGEARLELAPAMQTLARQRFDSGPSTLPPAGDYHYACTSGRENIDTLLRLRAPAADGSVSAMLDVLVMDAGKLLETMQVEVTGKKDAAGGYVFTPVTTLQASKKYQVQHLTEYGARTFDNLRVGIKGAHCQAPEAELALKPDSPASWTAVRKEAQHQSLLAQQRMVTEKLVGSLARFRENYSVQVSRQSQGQPVINSRHTFSYTGFLWMRQGEDAVHAWQCTDRSFTVTIRPKRDLPLVYQDTANYPVKAQIRWSAAHLTDGDAAIETKTSADTYTLPVKATDSLTDTVTFKCLDDYAIHHGQRSGLPKHTVLRMKVGGDEFVVSRTAFAGQVFADQVRQRYDSQYQQFVYEMNRNAENDKRYMEESRRQVEQEQANKKLVDEQKKALREAQQAAERKAEERRRKELACAREKAANGGKPKLFSDCDGL